MDIYPVLVTGVFNSGKTSFIQTLNEIDSIVTEHEGYVPATHVMDFGRLTLDENNVIYLFGLHGARWAEINDILESFERDFGIIFMVDSSMPMTFREAHSLLHGQFIPSGLPCVVAVNKQDHPDAWDVESVRNALKVPPDVPVLPCIAKERETVKPVLIRLFELWSTWGDDVPDPGDAESAG